MAIRYGALRNQGSHYPGIQGVIGIATAYFAGQDSKAIGTI